MSSGELRCPDCDTWLQEVVVVGIERLICEACSGAMVAPAQMREMANALGVSSDRLALCVDPAGAGPACPHCATPMKSFYLDNLGTLSACKQHGIWFPSGTLGTFIHRAITPGDESMGLGGSDISKFMGWLDAKERRRL